jgi:hypothetical protein
MNEYVFIFRNKQINGPQPSADQLNEMMRQWKTWMEGIASKNQLVSPGNRLGVEGKIVQPNKLIIDGPFTESKEIVGGFIIVRANSAQDAADIATGCPILKIGGTVEVRNIIDMAS